MEPAFHHLVKRAAAVQADGRRVSSAAGSPPLPPPGPPCVFCTVEPGRRSVSHLSEGPGWGGPDVEPSLSRARGLRQAGGPGLTWCSAGLAVPLPSLARRLHLHGVTPCLSVSPAVLHPRHCAPWRPALGGSVGPVPASSLPHVLASGRPGPSPGGTPTEGPACGSYISDVDVLKVERSAADRTLVLNLCTYHHPENIQLPPG